MTRRPTPRVAALTQGTFFIASGLWPILDIESFQRVTGRKRDRWLVKTMGGLIAVVGGVLLHSAVSKTAPPSKLLAVGSAAALGLSDVIYATRGVISKVYLADAAAEAALIALWMAASRDARRPNA